MAHTCARWPPSPCCRRLSCSTSLEVWDTTNWRPGLDGTLSKIIFHNSRPSMESATFNVNMHSPLMPITWSSISLSPMALADATLGFTGQGANNRCNRNHGNLRRPPWPTHPVQRFFNKALFKDCSPPSPPIKAGYEGPISWWKHWGLPWDSHKGTRVGSKKTLTIWAFWKCPAGTYCWWKKSCTTWCGKHPTIYRGFLHPRWCRISCINSSRPS